MKNEKKQEMSLIEQRMRKTAQLEREGKLPTLTEFLGSLPLKDEKPQKKSKNLE